MINHFVATLRFEALRYYFLSIGFATRGEDYNLVVLAHFKEELVQSWSTIYDHVFDM